MDRKIFWINFLHIYQPPTQDRKILEKVVKESYAYILELLEKNPSVKFTINISGSLLEKLQEFNYNREIQNFKKVLDSGQIELTGTAMYHPILPLIPEKEVDWQIRLNNKKIEEIFGDYKPRGFYLPEMAYSKEVSNKIKELGFEWTLLDPIHVKGETINNSKRYQIEGNDLGVIFRDRKFSKSFPPKSITENLERLQEKYLITAHDGEMYGHWHKDLERFSEKIFSDDRIKTLTASEYFDQVTSVEYIDPRPASWESTEIELENNEPYEIWNSSKNKIQKKLWKFADWVYSQIEKNNTDPNYSFAKNHYDKGIASCYWWWASEKKLDAFSPVSWNPSDIEKGAEELLEAVRSLKKAGSKIKLLGESKFNDFREMIWNKHWRKNK